MTIKINKLITSILVTQPSNLKKEESQKMQKRKKNKNQNSPKPY